MNVTKLKNHLLEQPNEKILKPQDVSTFLKSLESLLDQQSIFPELEILFQKVYADPQNLTYNEVLNITPILIQNLNPDKSAQVIQYSIDIIIELLYIFYHNYYPYLMANNFLSILSKLLSSARTEIYLSLSEIFIFLTDNFFDKELSIKAINVFIGYTLSWIFLKDKCIKANIFQFIANCYKNPLFNSQSSYDINFLFVKQAHQILSNIDTQASDDLLKAIFSFLNVLMINYDYTENVVFAAQVCWQVHVFHPKCDFSALYFLTIALTKLEQANNHEEDDNISFQQSNENFQEQLELNKMYFTDSSLSPDFIKYIDFNALNEIFKSNKSKAHLNLSILLMFLTKQGPIFNNVIINSMPICEILVYFLQKSSYKTKINALTIFKNMTLTGGPEVQQCLIFHQQLLIQILKFSIIGPEEISHSVLKITSAILYSFSPEAIQQVKQNLLAQDGLDILYELSNSENEELCDDGEELRILLN